MCAVSNTVNYGQRIRPTPFDWAKFVELIIAAQKFDRDTGQPDCEDKEKLDWMKKMEERISALENKEARY